MLYVDSKKLAYFGTKFDWNEAMFWPVNYKPWSRIQAIICWLHRYVIA